MRKLLHGGLYLAASRLLLLLSGLVIHAALTRLLSVADYALFGVLVSVLAVAQTVVTGGMQYAVSRVVAAAPGDAAAALHWARRLQVRVAFLATLGLLVLAQPLASLLQDGNLVWGLRAIGLLLPAYGLFVVYYGVLNGMRAFHQQAWVQLTLNLVKAGSALALAGLGAIAALLGYGIGALAGALHAALALRRMRHPPLAKLTGWTPAAPQTLILSILAVITALQVNIDILMVKRLAVEPGTVASYAAMAALGKMPHFLGIGLAAAVFPYLVRAVARGNPEEVRQLLTQGLRLLLAVEVLGWVLIAGLSEPAAVLVYPGPYAEAHGLLAPIAAAAAAMAVLNLLMLSLVAMGKAGTALWASTLALLLSMLIGAWLIPAVGVAGAPVAMIACAGVALVLCLWYQRRRIVLRALSAGLLRVGAATGAAWVAAGWVPSGLALAPIAAAGIAVVYVGVLFISGEISSLFSAPRADLQISDQRR
jgi:O-antigen/teichoic acid export membrane protein